MQMWKASKNKQQNTVPTEGWPLIKVFPHEFDSNHSGSMPNAFYSRYPCLYHSYTQDWHARAQCAPHQKILPFVSSFTNGTHLKKTKKTKTICHLLIKHHSFIIKQLCSIYRWVHKFHKWETFIHGKMQCLRKVVYFWYMYQYILLINFSWQNTWGFC